MTRARRPDDWEQDLAEAKPSERRLAAMLSADPRLGAFEDHTGDYDRLDFSFLFRTRRVSVDLKEKRSRYSAGIAELWPECDVRDLFIVDETVYRRIVWQGGGGYLIVHDHPGARWALFGPWELTLGPRVRYQRWGTRAGRFLKGKILLNLGAAAHVSRHFSIDDLLAVINGSENALGAVDAVATRGQSIPRLG